MLQYIHVHCMYVHVLNVIKQYIFIISISDNSQLMREHQAHNQTMERQQQQQHQQQQQQQQHFQYQQNYQTSHQQHSYQTSQQQHQQHQQHYLTEDQQHMGTRSPLHIDTSSPQMMSNVIGSRSPAR